MKKILILGGTNFIGRNLVERLLKDADNDITLFNRQKTQTSLFPEVNKIRGDRETDDVKKIENENWDYVIDCSCYYPESLEKVLSCLSTIKRYLFISTCSVYDNEDDLSILRNESAKILNCSPDQKVDRSPTSYGQRKAECERILKASKIPHTIFRPALVFGDYDPTDRLYYWLYQVKKNSTLILPENGERMFSVTYVFDLVECIIHELKQKGNSETYNVISCPQMSIKKIVSECMDMLELSPKMLPATAEFLIQKHIAQWSDMPLWINGDHFTYSNEKQINAFGKLPTNFSISLRNTIKYYERQDWPEPKFGIHESKRLALIENLSHQ